VILNRHDQSVLCERAVGYGFDHETYRVVVVCHLGFRGVHTVDGLVEIAQVIIPEPEKHEVGRNSCFGEFVKLALPFAITPEIGKRGIPLAKIRISKWLQGTIRGSKYSQFLSKWVVHIGYRPGLGI